MPPLSDRARPEPGHVLATPVVAGLNAVKQPKFQHRSDATLKSVDEPAALFEVGE